LYGRFKDGIDCVIVYYPKGIFYFFQDVASLSIGQTLDRGSVQKQEEQKTFLGDFNFKTPEGDDSGFQLSTALCHVWAVELLIMERKNKSEQLLW